MRKEKLEIIAAWLRLVLAVEMIAVMTTIFIKAWCSYPPVVTAYTIVHYSDGRKDTTVTYIAAPSIFYNHFNVHDSEE